MNHMKQVVIVLVCACAATAANGAIEPTAANPLFPPLFTIDPNSPQVPALSSAHVLTPFDPNVIPDPNDPGDPNHPTVVFRPHDLRLTPMDWIDGLSLAHTSIGFGSTFAIVFSVDRRAVGAVPPDPGLAAQGFAFNVQDQAAKNQAAGDAYIPLALFNRFGPITLAQRVGGNNSLVINNGDAGGVDFTAKPTKLSPTAPNPGPQTNVNGGAGSAGATALRGLPMPGPFHRPLPSTIFFSLQRNSPTLTGLGIPGSTGSGADIYIDLNPFAFGGESLYAAPPQLGLQFNDDIDGFIVFDNGDLVYSPFNDQVIFTLRPNSPSLAGIFAPGDLLTSNFGVINLYATATFLGLTRNPLDPQHSDNVDFLDVAPCENFDICLHDWAIRLPCLGDVDRDGFVDIVDVALLLASYATCDGDPDFDSNADFDENGCIDLIDLSLQLSVFGTFCYD